MYLLTLKVKVKKWATFQIAFAIFFAIPAAYVWAICIPNALAFIHLDLQSDPEVIKLFSAQLN